VKETHDRERERMTKVMKSQEKKAQQSRNTLLIELQHHYYEQGDSWFFRNVGAYLLNYAASHIQTEQSPSKERTHAETQQVMIKINEEMKKKQKMNKARWSQKSNKKTMPEG
jgi:hypothetical protein